MEIIYHERRPNYMATIRSLGVGDVIMFPWAEISCETSLIRVACAKIDGKFSVNKTEEGMKVTRTA